MPDIKMSDGCSIHYQFDGEVGKPILLFSNPHGFNYHLWDHQVEALAAHFRILRYDFRGHGGSEIWTGAYSLERAARDVVELIENLAQTPVAFCGLSIGGMVGIWLAANKPELISAAVLANTSLHLVPADHLQRRLQLIENSGMSTAVDDIISRSLSEGYRRDHPAEVEKLEKMIDGMSASGYIAGGNVVLEMDLREYPEKINIPVLVIAGSKDTSTPPAMGKMISERIHGAQYALLESAHLSNIERHREFNQSLLSFLEQQVG